jgi:1-deoxy-D-xylulose-5-phosphate synthase
MCNTALEIAKRLESFGIQATIIDPIFVKPLDTELFCRVLSSHTHVITIEEHSMAVGLASIMNSFIVRNGFTHLTVASFGIPDMFIEQGSNKEILEEIGLSPDKIWARLVDIFNLEKNLVTSDRE